MNESTAIRVGVILVLTTDDRDLLTAHGRALSAAYGFDAVSRCIPDQPTGVHDDRTFAAAAPKVATLAQRMVTDDRVDAR